MDRAGRTLSNIQNAINYYVDSKLEHQIRFFK